MKPPLALLLLALACCAAEGAGGFVVAASVQRALGPVPARLMECDVVPRFVGGAALSCRVPARFADYCAGMFAPDMDCEVGQDEGDGSAEIYCKPPADAAGRLKEIFQRTRL